MSQLNSSLEAQAKILGVDLFGVTHISNLENHAGLIPKSILNRYTYAVSIGYVIPSSILYNSTKEVYHQFLENSIIPTLNRTAIYLSRIIEKKNGKAFPVPAYNFIYDCDFPFYFHDLVASYAGIGWLGKNNRLVNKLYGSRVQTTTILTDIELEISDVAENLCNDCTICVDSCPEKALSGMPFHPQHNISERQNPEKCIIMYGKNKISETCLKCINTCPYNK
jgi:epoxyqueuosine reductase QueG